MNLLESISTKIPYFFETFCSLYLKKKISSDFMPNGYIYFEDESSIKYWGLIYSEYFKEKRKEYFALYSNDNSELLPYAVYQWYSGYYYININSYLRGSKRFSYPQHIIKRIDVLKKEISRFGLNENIVVVRRISNDFLKDYLLKGRKLKKGLILIDEAFQSTSLDLFYRKNSESDYEPLNDEVLMIIKIPKGVNAIYLEQVSKREEYELLLQSNLSMVVEKKIQFLNNKLLFVRIMQ